MPRLTGTAVLEFGSRSLGNKIKEHGKITRNRRIAR